MRLGLQNIVWGKTEVFRTTDQFNPQDLALSSLPTLEESRAWTTGGVVDDDATVEASFSASVGATPHRELSALFRRFVQLAYHQNGAAGNGV